MKELMLGNSAVARGIYEAGCRVISAYPGTPSTEITECAAAYSEMYSEWAPNEKVAMEVAIGASIGGARAFCAMKHVGLNVAADPLFTVSYSGVNGGLVVAVADDPGMHSSQNEQDSRNYAKAAKVLMLEPSDSAECLAFAKAAFDISEEFDTPVLLRLSTRVSHSQSLLETSARDEKPLKEYIKNPQKYVMMPAYAKARRIVIEERAKKIQQWVETTPLNTQHMAGTEIGVITSGAAYQYVREALPNASVLKLGVTYPLPIELIKSFASKVEKIYVAEELDPFIEEHCKSIGVNVIGKEIFTNIGEYSQRLIRKAVLGEEEPFVQLDEVIPPRPPAMCPGCPHRGMFYTLSKMKLNVLGDIGCYTLGAAPPLSAMDTTICMGASISSLHGFNKARGELSQHSSVAVIGDSTFMHSGITGLIDITYNRGISTVIIADNSITGMTGHQQNPTTGFTLGMQPTYAVSIEAVCRAVGIERVTVVDPNDMAKLEEVLKTELAADEPSVIITRRPCVLLKNVKREKPYVVDGCKGCKKCIAIGCPAISMRDGKAVIDDTLCVGCGVCAQLCSSGALISCEEAAKK